MEWMLLPYKRYADFQGRSRRKEFWMFALFWFVIAIVFEVLAMVIGGYDPITHRMNPLGMLLSGVYILFALGSLIPSLALSVRRLHDQNKSGWFVLLGFIPLLGGLILLVFYCLDGTKGPNKYGADPKRDEAEVF